MSLTLLSRDASLLAVELPPPAFDSCTLDLPPDNAVDQEEEEEEEGRIVMDRISFGGGGGRLGSCRFDGDLSEKQFS